MQTPLLSPDPAEGTPSNPPSEPTEAPPVAPPTPPTQRPPPNPPPAARIVVQGTKTEREVALEVELKAREGRIAELEDENRTLKTPPNPSPPVEAQQQKNSWLEGLPGYED
jgi:hypothetical protein